jgi:hypothetical protein
MPRFMKLEQMMDDNQTLCAKLRERERQLHCPENRNYGSKQVKRGKCSFIRVRRRRVELLG